MKFTCQRQELAEAVSICSKAASTKSSNPALEGILIKADRELIMTGYNLRISLRTELSADIVTSGSAVFNAKLFSDIVRALPDGPVTISVKESTATISAGASIMNISVLKAEDYPELPIVIYDYSFTMPQSVLKELIIGTIFSASDSELKPILTGTLFRFSDNNLEMAALDNFRLAIRRYTFKNEPPVKEELSFNVPATALRELERLMSDTDEVVTLSLAKRNIMFKIGPTVLTTNLIAGEFFNYSVMINAEATTTVEANVQELISSIERTSIIISERLRNHLKLNFDEELLRLSCVSSLGTSYDECSYITFSGSPVEIGFNSMYLLDALRACRNTEKVKLSLRTPVSPLIITPCDDSENPEEFLYLIVPVRLRA
ncbi:MAG: DNA polymerase III subunit beta [Clostridiales bacterium]|nr:DNA polymerase III subunit beta [Clostridiales bacterium]